MNSIQITLMLNPETTREPATCWLSLNNLTIKPMKTINEKMIISAFEEAKEAYAQEADENFEHCELILSEDVGMYGERFKASMKFSFEEIPDEDVPAPAIYDVFVIEPNPIPHDLDVGNYMLAIHHEDRSYHFIYDSMVMFMMIALFGLTFEKFDADYENY